MVFEKSGLCNSKTPFLSRPYMYLYHLSTSFLGLGKCWCKYKSYASQANCKISAHGPSYGGVWGLKSLGFEGPRAVWSVWGEGFLAASRNEKKKQDLFCFLDVELFEKRKTPFLTFFKDPPVQNRSCDSKSMAAHDQTEHHSQTTTRSRLRR